MHTRWYTLEKCLKRGLSRTPTSCPLCDSLYIPSLIRPTPHFREVSPPPFPPLLPNSPPPIHFSLFQPFHPSYSFFHFTFSLFAEVGGGDTPFLSFRPRVSNFAPLVTNEWNEVDGSANILKRWRFELNIGPSPFFQFSTTVEHENFSNFTYILRMLR